MTIEEMENHESNCDKYVPEDLSDSDTSGDEQRTRGERLFKDVEESVQLWRG